MLAGGSAGGLAAFLHADFVGKLLPRTLMRYRAVPVSGFFLMHATLRGAPAFADVMRDTYKLHHAAVSDDCTASLPPAEAYRCFFANYSYAHARTPMFPIQSAVDLYQLSDILQVGACPPLQSMDTYVGACCV